MNSLPLLRVVVGLGGDTSTRAIIARIEPDFAMRAFASSFDAQRTCRISMRCISVTETMPYE
jgi:hypothetical protein